MPHRVEGVNWRVIRKGFSILMLFLWAVASDAKDYIGHMSFFEDVSGQLAFENLPQKDFKDFSGVLSKGYSPSTFWIRLHIDPEGTTDPLVLRIRPNYLDEIVLYDPELGSMGRAATGDEVKTRDHYESLNLSLTIPAGGTSRDVWLRIRTKSSFLFTVEALHLDDIARDDQVQHLKSAFYLSLIGLFIIWGTLNWWGTRDQVIALFVLKQTLGLVYLAGILGYVRYFWPISWSLSPGFLVDMSMGFYGAAAFWFEYRFLREFRPNQYLLSALRWMPAFLPIYFILTALGWIQWAFMLCMILFVVGPILTFCLAWTTKPVTKASEGQLIQLPRKLLVTVYGVILLGLSSTTLPVMGWVLAGSMVFDGPLIYSLMNGLAILVLLQLRINMSERQRVALEIQNREVKKQVEIERSGREEQSRFLAMLTHELRTPMTAIRMSLGASDCDPAIYSEAEESIAEMAAILDRCLTADQLDQGKLTPRSGEFWGGVELRSLITRCTDSSRVELEMDADVPIKKDVVLFRMVMANLIDNALKYSESSSKVSIKAEQVDSLWSIRVENVPGKAGWPDPEQLFQKYYRSPRAQLFSGTGLGLYLARELSRSLGGELLYTPCATHIGFTLCLPL